MYSFHIELFTFFDIAIQSKRATQMTFFNRTYEMHLISVEMSIKKDLMRAIAAAHVVVVVVFAFYVCFIRTDWYVSIHSRNIIHNRPFSRAESSHSWHKPV